MKQDFDIPNVVDSRNRTRGCSTARKALGRTLGNSKDQCRVTSMKERTRLTSTENTTT